MDSQHMLMHFSLAGATAVNRVCTSAVSECIGCKGTRHTHACTCMAANYNRCTASTCMCKSCCRAASTQDVVDPPAQRSNRQEAASAITAQAGHRYRAGATAAGPSARRCLYTVCCVSVSRNKQATVR
jgi:hypothetical protein